MESGIYKGDKVRKPWLKHYGDIPEFTDVPDLTMYELLRDTAVKYPDKTAVDYMGKKIPFGRFLSMIDRCAASFAAYGG